MILETMGNVMTLAVCVAFVTSRDMLSAGFAGLVISYALNITQTLNWFVRMATEFETKIVSIERINEYSQMPIEVRAYLFSCRARSSSESKLYCGCREGLAVLIKVCLFTRSPRLSWHLKKVIKSRRRYI